VSTARRPSIADLRSPGRLLLISSAILLVAVIVALTSGGGGSLRAPLPGIGRPAKAGDPFAYSSARQAHFVQRAIAGEGHVLFIKSPSGVTATAARVAAFRPMIDAAVAGTGIDPAVLEGIVFVESAGRPDVIAGSDPSSAAGLTQILAETGQSLLGMHVDLARSRRLLKRIGDASSPGQVRRLLAQLAKADERFNPRKALAATVRYLQAAQRRFGRSDLAVVSYHMGIGNLENVLGSYDGGHSVPYAQLYFDSAPDRHRATFELLAGFGDQSSLYYWRVLGAAAIMRLYRSDRAALARLARLQLAGDSTELVLHPPDRTPSYATPGALSAAYARRQLIPLPANGRKLGLAYDRAMGTGAHRVGAPGALYRGLRPAALDLLVELGVRVRALAGTAALLTVSGTVSDRRYQQKLGIDDAGATTGYSFQIERRYVSRRQAAAFQAMLDRLQSLNVIAWTRTLSTIKVTVASDASRVIVDGP
jgi:Transglycosylase SLT domain